YSNICQVWERLPTTDFEPGTTASLVTNVWFIQDQKLKFSMSDACTSGSCHPSLIHTMEEDSSSFSKLYVCYHEVQDMMMTAAMHEGWYG
ncbi:hypothetical protein Dimus_016264, partial [Dionaea muscipula]